MEKRTADHDLVIRGNENTGENSSFRFLVLLFCGDLEKNRSLLVMSSPNDLPAVGGTNVEDNSSYVTLDVLVRVFLAELLRSRLFKSLNTPMERLQPMSLANSLDLMMDSMWK